MSLVKSSLENQPYYNLESIFRAFKRKEMKASHRLAENDIITRGITVKIQQVAVHRNYENPSNDAKESFSANRREAFISFRLNALKIY
jgi:hypothetical protein